METILEIILHVVLGLIVTVCVLILAFPETKFMSSVNVAVTVTAVKILVNYGIRRYFTRKPRGKVRSK